LNTIRAKGFAKVSNAVRAAIFLFFNHDLTPYFSQDKTVDALRAMHPMNVEELAFKIEGQLASYMDNQ
jgi:hypothetical protein